MAHFLTCSLRILAVAAAAAVLGGCVSYSALQTARTLPKGKASFALAGGYESLTVDVPGPSPDGNSTVITSQTLHLPVVEYGLRYGLRDGIDAGLRTNILGSTTVDLKVRAVDTGRYALAGGVGLGYSRITVGVGAYATKITATEVHVPVYNSLILTPSLELYVTPRYVYRIVSGSGADSLAGASAGVILGRATAAVAEVSAYQDLGAGSQIVQVMAGVIFGEDAYDRAAAKADKKKKNRDGG